MLADCLGHVPSPANASVNCLFWNDIDQCFKLHRTQPGKLRRMKSFFPLLLTFYLYTFAQKATSGQSDALKPASPNNLQSIKTSTNSASTGNRKSKNQKKSKSKSSDEPNNLDSITFNKGVTNIVISHIHNNLKNHDPRLI